MIVLGRLEGRRAAKDPQGLLKVVVIVVVVLTSGNRLLASGLFERRGFVPVGCVIIPLNKTGIKTIFNSFWSFDQLDYTFIFHLTLNASQQIFHPVSYAGI